MFADTQKAKFFHDNVVINKVINFIDNILSEIYNTCIIASNIFLSQIFVYYLIIYMLSNKYILIYLVIEYKIIV